MPAISAFPRSLAIYPTLRKSDWFHADGFPIAVEVRDPQEPFGLHCHDFWEIVIVTGGTGRHVTGEDSWQLATGDAFVIGGSLPHDYLNLEELRLVNVLFAPDEMSLDMQDLSALAGYHALFHLEPAWRKKHQFRSRLRLNAGDLHVAVAFVDRLQAELASRKAGFGFVATALFMQLVAHLSRCYGRAQNADSRAILRVAKTITHIETHFAKQLNLDDLVKMSQMSRRSFLRAFEAATGSTPIAYMIQLRLNSAAALLRRTDQSVTEIAFAVGFQDSNYFARQFRKQHGISPSQYRERNR